jgi:hypothetical protein
LTSSRNLLEESPTEIIIIDQMLDQNVLYILGYDLVVFRNILVLCNDRECTIFLLSSTTRGLVWCQDGCEDPMKVRK